MPEIPDTLDILISSCADVVRRIDPHVRSDVMESFRNCKRIFVYGSGRSGLIGRLFTVRLVQMGYNVHFMSEMTTPAINAGDLVLLISNTGNTFSVVETAKIARKRGLRVISITGNRDNELSKNSDITVVLDVPHDAELGGIAPLGTIFEDSSHLFFECLVSELMKRDGITEEDMRNRHAIWI